MSTPIVGIIANRNLVDNLYWTYSSAAINACAVIDYSNASPLIIPPIEQGWSLERLLSIFDGFLLTGGRSNINPAHYNNQTSGAPGSFDNGRDTLTLPLVRACVARGQPIFGICRGCQEMNVAFGGTLDQAVSSIMGRIDHRGLHGAIGEARYGPRHEVNLRPGGIFHRLLGTSVITTNSLHGQAISMAGERVVIEGLATDGTPEAISIADAKGFALGVQWHPEGDVSTNSDSQALFNAFGDACRDWHSFK